MDRLLPPAESIESFARLCARLGDVFAPRAALLTEVGLDEAGFRRIERAWMSRLDEPLAQRFAAAFAAPGQSATAAEPAPQAWREAARSVPLLCAGDTAPLPDAGRPEVLADRDPMPFADTAPIDVDQTLELPIGRPAPSLPFRPAPAAGHEAGLQERHARTPPASPPHLGAANENAADQTLACPLDAHQRAALPFQKAPSAPPPRGRLHRFDPQTGLPLPVAVWVELPQMPSLKP